MDDELAAIRLCVEGPIAHHNMPCAVCHTRKSVYSINEGIFKPCWKCQETWELRRKPWYCGLFAKPPARAGKGGRK